MSKRKKKNNIGNNKPIGPTPKDILVACIPLFVGVGILLCTLLGNLTLPMDKSRGFLVR